MVWGEEMEMYGESDRCKIPGGRGKGGNDEEEGAGVRGGEVERKDTEMLGGKLTDAAMERETRGKGWVVMRVGVSGFFSAFTCTMRQAKLVLQEVVEEEEEEEEKKQSWVDEHGKAFTKSAPPPEPCELLEASRGTPPLLLLLQWQNDGLS
ncbi:hypothetical protein D9C73_007760 [Collichthys lucidus]|uniref:Uncharacterized protein n=1 Tax=Collichthys lucidus TaxID=240159 RepID=A0A4U5UHS7_COLLU|nr:hypothetical protein D9C73_007760 [Collichthys lucidus]